MVRPDWSLPVNQIAVGSIRLFVTEGYVVCEKVRRCKCILENNGMPGLTTSNSWNLTRLSTEIVAFIFIFFFQGIARF